MRTKRTYAIFSMMALAVAWTPIADADPMDPDRYDVLPPEPTMGCTGADQRIEIDHQVLFNVLDLGGGSGIASNREQGDDELFENGQQVEPGKWRHIMSGTSQHGRCL